jgi:hypothetical protein
MARRRPSLNAWREWRRTHYADGEPRPAANLSWMLTSLLATKGGSISLLRADRRNAKKARPQHTPPAIKDADYLHAAYGRRRGRA